VAALALGEDARARATELFERWDVLLTPAARGSAPSLDSTGDPLFCRAWTLLGTPVLAVPGIRGTDGLPVGVQLVGRPGDDARLLASAAWVERQLA
jgi:Asp-tRNA(Asn)/Glu-tRNA(Gln) amidotransferase A subunit family amidase